MYFLVMNKSPKGSDNDLVDASRATTLLTSVNKYTALALYAIEQAKRL